MPGASPSSPSASSLDALEDVALAKALELQSCSFRGAETQVALLWTRGIAQNGQAACQIICNTGEEDKKSASRLLCSFIGTLTKMILYLVLIVLAFVNQNM